MARMIAARTGTPIPTLTPMMTLVSTPWTSPSGCSIETPPSPAVAVVDDVGGGGIYDVGDPVVASMDFIFVPNGTGVAIPVPVVSGKVASEPEGMTVTCVNVLLTLVVVCMDPGQLTKPVVSQPVPVKVTTLVSVVVSRSSSALAVIAAVDAVVVVVRP